MSSAFVDALLREGRLTVGAEPEWKPSDADCAALRQAFADDALHLPGPPLEADLETMLASVGVLYRAGWLMLHPVVNLSDDELSRRMPAAARTPSAHLSADVALCF